ncbi:hypothetical protein JCM8547_006206 [Rhodosporidiobolus lusitaniae]
MSSASTFSFTPFTASSPSFCFDDESMRASNLPLFSLAATDSSHFLTLQIDLFALFSTAPLPSSTSTAAEPSFERWIDGTTDFEPEEHALPPLKPAVLSRPVRISKKRLSVCSTASTDSEDLSSMLDAFEESIASFPSLFPSPALPPSSPSSSSSSSSTSSPASLYFLSNSSSSTISSILSAYSVDPYSPSAPAEPVDCWRCYNDNFLPPSLLPPVPSPPRLSPQRVAELEKQRAAERHGRSSPFLR